MSEFVNRYLDPTKELKILDVGASGHTGTYKDLFLSINWKYEGTDIHSGPNVDFVMEQYWIPRDTSTYDVVVSGQTLEHVEYFWNWAAELVRVLKPGGLLCLIAPGGGPIHRDPLDCWRIHPDGMDVLAKWCMIEKLESYMTYENEWQDCILIARK